MRGLMGFISTYQRVLSPLLGQRCIYYPTCSSYTYEAIEVYGAVRGSWLGMRRIGRCHPFRDAGFDPVPKVGDQPEEKSMTSCKEV